MSLYIPRVYRSQKRAQDPLELGTQAVMSFHMGALK